MSKEHTSVSGALDECALEFTPLEAITGTVMELRASFAGGVLHELSTRKHHLQAFLRGLREEKKALLDAVYQDLRKSHAETELFEFGAVEFEIGQFLENLDKWARPDRPPLAMLQPAFLLSRSEVRKEPLGTVAIIGSWNYPIRILLLPAVGAIAAGNTVVLKPSEHSPHTAQAIERMIAKYMDPRVIRLVQGGVPETTELLRQKFDHYFYTGNGQVGKIVARAAADHLAGVTLELGGKCPAIVHADVADLVPTATRIMWAKLANGGQTCVGVDYVLVHRSVKDKLVALLIEATIGMYGKSPQKSSEYGRIINKKHWGRLMALLEKSDGAQIQVTDDEPDENDLFIPPTIIDGVQSDDSLMSEELFGPILPIITYDTLDEALSLVNGGDQPLALYAFATRDTANYIISQTRTGTAAVNDTMLHLASHSNPFGGVGPSGVGNYTGKYSFDTFSHHRYVLYRPLWFPTPGVDSIRSPPFSGPENRWKTNLSGPMAYPRPWSLRDSLLGKLFTLIPLWRLLAIIPGFIVAIFTGRPIIRRKK
ncbi:hypothetical protein GGF46_004143 [Coemansia sp. RSA 552]|nr:hypothetical protein GGF46_004143 [Coemansia sp. RSA 552]